MTQKILAPIFILFALVQYNDGDWYLWMPIYLIVAVILLINDVRFSKKILLAIMGIYLMGMLSYFPDFVKWLKDGMPSITESMQAKSPYIEHIREFLGLFICLLALTFKYRKIG